MEGGGVMDKACIILRWIMSLALLYGVYTETGMWTTIVLFLILSGQELDYYVRRHFAWEVKLQVLTNEFLKKILKKKEA
jgi:hypothetical protein